MSDGGLGSGSERSGEDSAGATLPPALGPRVEKLRALRSAWSVLAPAGVSVPGQNIAEVGRAFSEYLGELASRGRDPDPATLADADERLADLAATLQEVATRVPTAQLRARMPASGGRARCGALDLLDLLIDGAEARPESISERISTIDYLVTLLCTGGEGHAIRHDPVTLTPGMSAFCEAVDPGDDPRVAELEAEFFAAAQLEGEDLQQEITLRQLRSRKVELGPLYFAPRVLRAIVTYNATLVERMAEQVWSAQDWGDPVAGLVAPAAAEDAAGSVFESEGLRSVADALRRRARGESPAPNDLDRIAWCLDLDYLDAVERKALLREDAGTRGNLLGTTILVGLLGRSLAVLSIELQGIGLSPDRVSDEWIAELRGLLQEETQARLAKHEYQQACVFSELRNKFLLAPLVDVQKHQLASIARPPGPAREATRYERRDRQQKDAGTARDLVREAMEEQAPKDPARASSEGGVAASEEGLRASLQGLFSWQRAAAAALCLVVASAVLVQAFGGRMLDPDLARFGGEELRAISSHLASGYRNGEGRGPAFVGTLDDSWLELSTQDRSREAEALVGALRGRGVSQVMVYDDDDRLRIQALGTQAVRIL